MHGKYLASPCLFLDWKILPEKEQHASAIDHSSLLEKKVHCKRSCDDE